jgi:hypothetical protein
MIEETPLLALLRSATFGEGSCFVRPIKLCGLANTTSCERYFKTNG